MICEYPPCKKKVHGKVKNQHGKTFNLCKEHYELGVKIGFKEEDA